jgi:mono/diheme cytochrome c family protein
MANAMSIVRTFSTKALGCAAGAALLLAPGSAAAQQDANGGQVTFAKDVAPILQRSCQGCHRVGQMAPMSLMTYQEVRPWARAIKTRVASREMPPWHVDRTIGIQKFKDDPSLTDEEIATIATWVDSGAPMGNPADMPPPRQFADGNSWQIGEPDLVIKFPKYRVPAEGPDLYGDLLADIPIDEDRYIQAIQTRSATQKSHKVVHHALSYSVDVPADGQDVPMDGGQFLVEYAQGKNAEVYPEGSGVLLKKGQRARVSYHLHAIGEEIDAEIELGLKLYPKGYTPKYIRWSRQLAQPTTPLDIPAGTVSRSDGYTILHKPARLIAFQPHMHNLGKRQCLELIYPTSGTRTTTEMLNCANFNNNWHLTYNYADDAQPLVPAGTILHNIQWHDNTPANPRALDPKNWVGDGQRTIDEMGFFWIGWVELTQEEYEQAVAERKAAQQGQSTGGNQ